MIIVSSASSVMENSIHLNKHQMWNIKHFLFYIKIFIILLPLQSLLNTLIHVLMELKGSYFLTAVLTFEKMLVISGTANVLTDMASLREELLSGRETARAQKHHWAEWHDMICASISKWILVKHHNSLKMPGSWQRRQLNISHTHLLRWKCIRFLKKNVKISIGDHKYLHFSIIWKAVSKLIGNQWNCSYLWQPIRNNKPEH